MALACASATITPAVAVAPALASAPRLVRAGVAPPSPAGSRALGSPAAATRIHVTVALEPRDPAALAAFAHQVSTPGSSVYRRYITRSEFAARFGATSAAIEAVDASLRAHGLSPGGVSANGLSIPVTASAGALEQALSVPLERLVLNGRRSAIVNRLAPALDASVAPLVQGVIGLDTLSDPQPLLVRRSGLARPSSVHARPRVVTGGPQPCAAATSAASGQSAYTADQLASAYGFSGLYQADDEGQGQTIALYELEPDDPSDIAAYQACFGTHASVSYVQVDGGDGSGPGSGEAALDIEAAIGLAPRANILVYQAPNSESNDPGAGPYDDFNAIVTQDRAHVISASWGQCEALEGATDAHAELTLFEEAAAQGQTIVSASGDDGSEDCYTGSPPGANTQLAVDDPASQPFVTAVGGTTLSSLGPRPSETAWNNGGSLTTIGTQPLGISPGAAGGGVSSLWTMPSYQSAAPSSLGVINGSSSRACAGSYCREVPDVSADADPNTGVVIYWNGSGSEVGQPSGWQGIGGTSAAAPMWGALMALINASSSCRGSDVGFANPGLYRAAATAYASDFNDVTTGNNDFTGTNASKYPAGDGYDLATGLGTPNGASLARTLCADTLQLTNPGSRSSTVKTSVKLLLRSLGTGGARVHYVANGLPPGLAIDSSTGMISGKPRRIGRYAVTVSGSDGGGSDAEVAFAWTIGGPPALSHGSLTGVARSRPELRFTVARGRGAPDIEALAITAPRGLRFASRLRDVRVAEAGGMHLKFTGAVVRGILRVDLTEPAGRITVTVRYAALTADGRLAKAARQGRSRRVTVRSVVTDALGNSTRATLGIKPSG